MEVLLWDVVRPVGLIGRMVVTGERLSAAATPARSASVVPRQINALRYPSTETRPRLNGCTGKWRSPG